MKIESITLVPMTKETIFGEEFEEFEFHGVTRNVDEWWEKQTVYNGNNFIDAANELYDEILKVKYLLMSPAVRFGYETLSLKTILAEDGSKLSELIAEHGTNFMLFSVLKQEFLDAENDFKPFNRYKIRYAIKNQTELNIDCEKYFDNPTKYARPTGRPDGYYVPRIKDSFVET